MPDPQSIGRPPDMKPTSYTVPVGTHIKRWRFNPAQWEKFVSTKEVTYRPVDCCGYREDLNEYEFRLPKEAFPYTVIRVDADDIVCSYVDSHKEMVEAERKSQSARKKAATELLKEVVENYLESKESKDEGE